MKQRILIFSSIITCVGLAFGCGAEEADTPEQINLSLDSDSDGLTDLEEADLGTDPNQADADGDSVNDGDEVALGRDPRQADNPRTQTMMHQPATAACAQTASPSFVPNPAETTPVTRPKPPSHAPKTVTKLRSPH